MFKSETHLRCDAHRNTEEEFPQRKYKQGVQDGLNRPVLLCLDSLQNTLGIIRKVSAVLLVTDRTQTCMFTCNHLMEIFCHFHEFVYNKLIRHPWKELTSKNSYSAVP